MRLSGKEKDESNRQEQHRQLVIGCAGCRSIPPCCRFGIWSPIIFSSFLFWFINGWPCGRFFYFLILSACGGWWWWWWWWVKSVSVGFCSPLPYFFDDYSLLQGIAHASPHTHSRTYECFLMFFGKTSGIRYAPLFFGSFKSYSIARNAQFNIDPWLGSLNAPWTCLYRSGESEMAQHRPAIT